MKIVHVQFLKLENSVLIYGECKLAKKKTATTMQNFGKLQIKFKSNNSKHGHWHDSSIHKWVVKRLRSTCLSASKCSQLTEWCCCHSNGYCRLAQTCIMWEKSQEHQSVESMKCSLYVMKFKWGFVYLFSHLQYKWADRTMTRMNESEKNMNSPNLFGFWTLQCFWDPLENRLFFTFIFTHFT